MASRPEMTGAGVCPTSASDKIPGEVPLTRSWEHAGSGHVSTLRPGCPTVSGKTTRGTPWTRAPAISPDPTPQGQAWWRRWAASHLPTRRDRRPSPSADRGGWGRYIHTAPERWRAAAIGGPSRTDHCAPTDVKAPVASISPPGPRGRGRSAGADPPDLTVAKSCYTTFKLTFSRHPGPIPPRVLHPGDARAEMGLDGGADRFPHSGMGFSHTL